MGGSEIQVVENLLSLQLWLRLSAVLCFGLALVVYGLLVSRQSQPQPSATGSLIGRLLFLAGTACLVANSCLLVLSPVRSFSIITFVGVALVISAITVAIERSRTSVALYFVSSALVFLILSFGSFLVAPRDMQWGAHSFVITFHVITAVAGEGLFIVAFGASILFLWFYKRLKQHKFEGNSANMPSLDVLDKIVERTSLLGLALITVSLVSGLSLTFGQNIDAGFVKIVWAFTVWTWFVLAILGRSFFGWRGRRGAILTIWGAALILVTFFGTVWTGL